MSEICKVFCLKADWTIDQMKEDFVALLGPWESVDTKPIHRGVSTYVLDRWFDGVHRKHLEERGFKIEFTNSTASYDDDSDDEGLYD